MQAAEWVPLRWPDGAGWLRPEALAILDGTPVNCLLLTEEPRAPASFLAAAARRNLKLLDAGALGRQPVTLLADPVWPGVKIARSGGDGESGPTGPPWVDSNGWRCLLARARQPGKPVWIAAHPPEDLNLLRPQPYALAIADAAAHGGRWIVSLHPRTSVGLLARDTAAWNHWRSIAAALEFFEQRSAWRTLPAWARLGVLSDFEGPNEFIGEELLNLLARRHLSCRVLDLAHTTAASLEGLKGVIWACEKEPEGALGKMLLDFVHSGGLLILPASAASLAAGLRGAIRHQTGYSAYPAGKGSIAVAPEPWTDPYVVASDAHLLLSRRHDVYRVFNSGASNVHCTRASGGGTILHIVSYTGRTVALPMSAFVARPHSWARWSHLDAPAPEPLPVVRAGGGVEVHLPAFAAYAVVEFGGQST